MLDFETMIKGAKIKWITRYLGGENADWKLLCCILRVTNQVLCCNRIY